MKKKTVKVSSKTASTSKKQDKPTKPLKATKKPSKKKVSSSFSEDEERENYLHNRNMMLKDFEACLAESQKEQSSVPGKIAGMTYKDFCIVTSFRLIKDQEEYTEYSEKYTPSYVNIAEEKQILNDMIAKCKTVFGEYYDTLYEQCNDD